MAGQMLPMLVGQVAERREHLAQVGLGLLEAREITLFKGTLRPANLLPAQIRCAPGGPVLVLLVLLRLLLPHLTLLRLVGLPLSLPTIALSRGLNCPIDERPTMRRLASWSRRAAASSFGASSTAFPRDTGDCCIQPPSRHLLCGFVSGRRPGSGRVHCLAG